MKKFCLVAVICMLVVSGCGESKPSKGEVKSSLKKMILAEMKADSDIAREAAEKYSNCIVDKVYDKLSVETLNRIVDIKTSEDFAKVEGNDKENEAFEKAAEACSKELVTE